MKIDHWLVLALWLVFIVYWAFAARGAKRNLDSRAARCGRSIRIAILILVLLAIRVPSLRLGLANLQFSTARLGAPGAALGLALCLAEFGLALWARNHIGRNWGMPMSRKEDPDLVTSGPYAYVRHPIYSGVLLAMIGSALVESVVWILPLILFGAYFIFSARREEKLMLEQFPAQYPVYRARTKMLIPFLF